MSKSSKVYWRDRKAQYDETLYKDETRMYAKLAAYYEKEAVRLDKEIASYYAEYGVNGVLSYRNLLETLPDADKVLLIEKIDGFVKKYPEYADLVPVRESIYKLNRLEGLRQSIALQQMEMGAYEQEQARAFFQRQALRYANGAAEYLGLGKGFYRLDHEMVQAAIGNKWCDGMDFSSRIWNNRTKLGNTLQTEIVNGFIRGEDYHTLSRNLRKKFVTVSQKNAERLVFTEDTYLSNEAAMLVFERDAAITEYTFVCTGDSETCDICRALSGQRFKIKDRLPGTNFPPMHPWCRCFFDPVVPEVSAFMEEERKNTQIVPAAIRLTDSQSGGIMSEETRIRIDVIPAMKTDFVVERQKIHRQGTKMYEDRKAALEKKGKYGPSYITISDEEILELVNRFKGTGKIKVKNGKWNNQEVILTNETKVGFVVNDITGKSVETTVFKIHYGKDGVHIVPDYPSKKKVK